MEALEPSVCLVVKAPNQQIEDQEIKCPLNWTVRKLKSHLSEAYPSKPKTEDQKLIYSGQLLHDHLALKDFLRQYETENVHTVHLVCLPSKESNSSKTFSTKMENVKTNITSSSSQSQPMLSTSHLTNDTMQQQQVDQVSPIVQLPPNFVYPSGLDQLTHFAWMQQAYSNYILQYYNQLQNVQPLTTMTPQAASSAVEQPLVQAGGGVRVEPRVPAANVRMNAQGGPVDDDDEDDDGAGNWDWLDWAYVLSRVTVLFSIVYFYSSFSRMMVVALVGVLMYFYQMGWLGARRRQRRHPIHQGAAARQPQQERNTEPVVAQNGGDGEEAAATNSDDAESDQMQQEIREIENLMNDGVNQEVRSSSLATIAWTFLTTFFSSLLPETPAPLNLN